MIFCEGAQVFGLSSNRCINRGDGWPASGKSWRGDIREAESYQCRRGRSSAKRWAGTGTHPRDVGVAQAAQPAVSQVANLRKLSIDTGIPFHPPADWQSAIRQTRLSALRARRFRSTTLRCTPANYFAFRRACFARWCSAMPSKGSRSIRADTMTSWFLSMTKTQA